MRQRLLIRAALASVAVCLVLSTANSDVVHLVGGRKIEGEVVGEDDRWVKVRVGGGVLSVERARVERVEKKETPEQELRSRASRLREGDATEAMELARIAASAGLAEDEGRFLAMVCRWEPENVEAAGLMKRWTRFVRELPGDPAEERVLRAWSARGTVTRSRHWVLGHETTEADAYRTLQQLEHAWSNVHALADRLGVATRPVERTLSAHLFSEFSTWTAAAGQTSSSLRDVVGLYDIKSRRILLYDTATQPDVAAFRTSLRVIRAEAQRAYDERYALMRGAS